MIPDAAAPIHFHRFSLPRLSWPGFYYEKTPFLSETKQKINI